MDPSADRAEAFLQTHGFACEREPPWILEGKKPDFFCRGRVSLWVEVKTLSATSPDRKRADVWRELQRRSRSISVAGDAFAEVSESATSRDIRVAMALTHRLLAEYEKAERLWRHAFVVIPRNPVYNRTVRFTIEEEEGDALILSCESRSGQYELPQAVEPRSYEQPISLIGDGECLAPQSLEDLVGTEHPLMALELTPGCDRFLVKGMELVDEDPVLRNSERLRGAVKDANRQLRNGQKYQRAPAMVLVYQDSLLVPEDVIVLAALYGDLTYTFPHGRPHEGRLSYGQNGAFGPRKHRSVSALSLIRNDTSPLTVHHSWAHVPLPAGVLGGREATLRSDGTFELTEFPA